MQRRIDHTSGRAQYRQLADILRQRMRSGEWEAERYLPSEAHLGSEYEVSQTTVRRALALLRTEGFVESSRGMPWRVRERGEPIVVKLRPGDQVRARVATREDQERHDIPEGAPVLVISTPGEQDRVYRADEVVGEVDRE